MLGRVPRETNQPQVEHAEENTNKQEDTMTGTTLNYTQIYTTDQAAEVLQINIQTLRKYIREGKLQASKLGSKDYRITGEDIKAFLNATKITKED